MRRLVFQPLAIEDMTEIAEYGRDIFGERQARRYAVDVQTACRKLASGELPGRPHQGRIPDIGKQRAGSHFVFYQVFPDRLVVVRVLHQAMNHGDHL